MKKEDLTPEEFKVVQAIGLSTLSSERGTLLIEEAIEVFEICKKHFHAQFQPSEEVKKIKWFTNFNRPNPSKDDDTFSVQVLINDGKGLFTVGWFDFKTSEWHYISDFELPEKFFWCYPPEPVSAALASEGKETYGVVRNNYPDYLRDATGKPTTF